jgi:hypothetical protein
MSGLDEVTDIKSHLNRGASCAPIGRFPLADSCPITTPAQRKYGLIQKKFEEILFNTVHEAINETAVRCRSEILEAKLDLPSPSNEYFAASLHQMLFCHLCKADAVTFSGGNAEIAIRIIQNAQNITKRYWQADIKPCP